jgi:hypothetical protein
MTISHKAEVTTDKRPTEWRGNNLRFATAKEAYDYLFTQTTYGSNIRKTRVCRIDEPVNARMHCGLSGRLEVLS